MTYFCYRKLNNSLLIKVETFRLNKNRVINHYKENGFVLVLDDFHYASNDIQLYIAQQLAELIGISKMEYIEDLGRMGIPYFDSDIEEVMKDIETLNDYIKEN